MSDKKAKQKGKQSEEAFDEHVRLSTHPGAAASVKRVRARCGLGGFVLVGVLCLHAGLTPYDAVERALIAGIIAHIVGWFVSITIWRQLIRLQVAQAAEAYNDRIRRAHLEASERAVAQLSAQQTAEAEAQASWAATLGS